MKQIKSFFHRVSCVLSLGMSDIGVACTRRSGRSRCEFSRRCPSSQRIQTPLDSSALAEASTEASAEATLKTLTSVYAQAQNWQPPPLARREGGLWMLTQEQIASLPQPQMAAAEYRVPCFEQYFGKHRTLPIVECARPAGTPLPALSLIHI